MKITIDRKAMHAAIGVISGIVPARSPKPVLQNIYLSVTDEGATVSATDLEVGISHRVDGVKVNQPGSILLSPTRFGSILKTSTDAELDIEASENTIRIRGHQSDFKLASTNPDEFPAVPEFTATAYHIVAARDLKQSIRRTMFATDVESTRYALGGVLFELSDTTLTCVATDGRRLARARCGVECEGEVPVSEPFPVIPLKALKLIEKLLDDDEGSVHLAIDGKSSILVRTSRASVYARLVEGRFPRYQDVFPAQPEVRIPVNAGALLVVVNQAQIVTSDESRGVDFHFCDGRLRLQAKAADVGSGDVEMAIDYDGKPVEITFDPRYLSDALRQIDEESDIEVELIDSKNAAVFRSGDTYNYVLMPLTKN